MPLRIQTPPTCHRRRSLSSSRRTKAEPWTGESSPALGSFQSGKRFVPVLAQYLTVLYPPPATSLRRATRSLTPPPKTQRQRTLTLNRVEWDDALEPTTEDVTIRQKPPRVSEASPRQSPRSTNQQPSGVRPPRIN